MITTNNGLKGYVNPSIYLDAIDNEFVSRMNNRLTLYGQIPYTVPTNLIIEVIKESAMTFYRMCYSPAKQKIWYRIPRKEIISFMQDTKTCCSNPTCTTFPNCEHATHHIHLFGPLQNFKGYFCRLPAIISSVVDIRKTNDVAAGSGTFGELEENDERFAFTRTIGAPMSNSVYGLRGINTHFYSIERSVKVTQTNAERSSKVKGIPYDYNQSTHILTISEDVGNYESIMIKCNVNVDVQYLYNDDLFVKYVYAKCKKELKRLLGGHTFQLPGDVQLNADEICAGFEEEISQVEEVLKGYNAMGDIILMR